MIKAAFFDIDGTVVSLNTHKMTTSLLSFFYDLRARGLKLFIASGRPMQVINNLEDFPFDGYVTMNGALSYIGGNIVSSHPIDRQEVMKLAEICKQNNMPVFLFGREVAGVNMMNERSWEMFRLIDLPAPEYIDIEEVAANEDIYQCTVYMTKEEEEALFRPYLSKVEIPRWHHLFADINPLGITKAGGIKSVCDSIGLSMDEIIAFGDGGNDIEMLGAAGIGVAMGNAGDAVKSVADYVTLSVEEDGVIEALKHFNNLLP